MTNKKQVIAGALTLISLLLIAGAAALFIQNDENTETPQNTEEAAFSPEPSPNAKPDNINVPEREITYNYTDEILSPNTVGTQPDSYLNKEITVRGWIVESSPNTYSLVSINIDEETGLRLSKSTTVQYAEYVDPPKDPSKQSKPVTLTGTLSYSGENQSLEFAPLSLVE